jgi:hypothetical protein
VARGGEGLGAIMTFPEAAGISLCPPLGRVGILISVFFVAHMRFWVGRGSILGVWRPGGTTIDGRSGVVTVHVVVVNLVLVGRAREGVLTSIIRREGRGEW